MRLVNITIPQKFNLLIILFSSVSIISSAQENSPYSRYGLGDVMPTSPIINRSMGGVSAAYVDYDKRFDLKEVYPKSQSVNFLNPASYAKLRITSFDLGIEVDNRTLRSAQQARRFSAAGANISYVQLGIPLDRKRSLGMNLGLRPVTRINYKIQQDQRLTGIDSVSTLYEGSGGSYQAYAGVGKSFKNLSVGVNTGYYFGTKTYSSRRQFIPDSNDALYSKSNHETKTTFGGIFFDMGAQYRAQLNKTTILHLGAYGNIKQKFGAEKDVLAETFNYDANGAVFRIDSVYNQKAVSGTLNYPATVGVGFMLEKVDKWQFGADFTTTSWKDYSFFGEQDGVANSWLFKVGGQVTPNLYNPKSYWGRVSYRAGFNFGPDYIRVGKDLPQFGFSLGAGFPIRKNPYTNQYTSINLGVEYGKRGNKNNELTENLFRIALGFTLSDLWFIKKKYQ